MPPLYAALKFLVPTDYTMNLTFHLAETFNKSEGFKQPNSDKDKAAEQGKHLPPLYAALSTRGIISASEGVIDQVTAKSSFSRPVAFI